MRYKIYDKYKNETFDTTTFTLKDFTLGLSNHQVDIYLTDDLQITFKNPLSSVDLIIECENEYVLYRLIQEIFENKLLQLNKYYCNNELVYDAVDEFKRIQDLGGSYLTISFEAFKQGGSSHLFIVRLSSSLKDMFIDLLLLLKYLKLQDIWYDKVLLNNKEIMV